MTIQHSRLHHRTPGWAPEGDRFHVRIRLESLESSLTSPVLGAILLESVGFYHRRGRWYAWLVVLMPDHLHAVLSFPPEVSMSRVIGEWKKYHATTSGVQWQSNYFDHRLRNDQEFVEKAYYIRANPVRKGLCKWLEDWPWVAEPWKTDG